MRLLLIFPIILSGCSFLGGLDAIHQKEGDWDLHLTWDRTEHVGPPVTTGKDGRQYDANGNLIPLPETQALFNFPPITAGFDVTVKDKPKISPILGIALVDVKIPYGRWFDIQTIGAQQQAGLIFQKRFTSIVEITLGGGCVYDFDLKKPIPCISWTITKF